MPSTKIHFMAVLIMTIAIVPCFSQTSTIVVKTNETVSTSGRNDIGVLRNYFFSGSPNDDNLTNGPNQALWPVTMDYTNAIGAHGMRSINGERDCSLDANGNFTPSNNLIRHLNILHDSQRDLHFIVGQSRPPVFPDGAWNWDAGQWNAYEDYAYKCIKYVMVDYKGGFQKSIIEVGNELDISGTEGYWFVDGKWNNSDLKAYAGYIKCYAEWSDAIKRFNKDYPQKQVRLFGPAITTYTFWYTPNLNWGLKFIEDAKTNNWQFDGLSFHEYGAEMLGGRPDYSGGKLPSFKSVIKQLQDQLDLFGFTNTELWITEWGCTTWTGTERIKNNYRPVGGAFAAAFMHEGLDNGVDGMVPLRLRDENSSSGWDRLGCLATINGVVYPKPTYNVYRMFYQLPGQRKKTEWQNPNVQLGAIASASSDSIGVIVYNYDWDNQNIVDRSEPHDVQVKISGTNLPDSVTVRRFLMDAQTSNVAKYVDAGLVPSVADCELQKVEEYTVKPVGGIITLPTKTIGQSAVSLWLVLLTVDVQAPTAPVGLTPSKITETSFTLEWTASTDNVGVKGYDIYEGSVLKGSTSSNSFNMIGLSCNTTYAMTVKAKDASGNISALSGTLNVTTSDCGSEIIKDNTDLTGIALVGNWTTSAFNAGYYGTNYLHDGNAGATGGKSAKFTPTIPTTGSYNVYVRCIAGSVWATNAPIDVVDVAGRTHTLSVNLQNNSGIWVLLGTFDFSAGTSGYVKIRNDGANGNVIADAVKWVFVTGTTTTDIESLEEPKGDIFRLFPNPADNKVYIQGKSEIFPVEVTLYDISGRAVLQETLNPGLPLNIETLQKGIYIVRISGKKQTRNFRLIKR